MNMLNVSPAHVDVDVKCLSYGATHVGCVRTGNEDAYLNDARNGVWAVADGMGGHGGGDIASARVIAALAKIGHAERLNDASGRVSAALKDANEDLRRHGAREFGGVIGATIVALIIRDGRFVCLWAGDSRLYRLRAGELKQLTTDHRYVQGLIDAGVLSESAAHAHPRAHVITRAVGAGAVLELDVREGAVRAGDRFLLCSDGLTNVVSSARIADALRRSPLEAAVERMMQDALARGAPDNITALAVAIDWTP